MSLLALRVPPGGNEVDDWQPVRSWRSEGKVKVGEAQRRTKPSDLKTSVGFLALRVSPAVIWLTIDRRCEVISRRMQNDS